MKQFMTILTLVVFLLMPSAASAKLKIKGGGWKVSLLNGEKYEYEGFQVTATKPDQEEGLKLAREMEGNKIDAFNKTVDKATSRVVPVPVPREVQVIERHYHTEVQVPVRPAVPLLHFQLTYPPPPGITIWEVRDPLHFRCSRGWWWRWCSIRQCYVH